MELKVDWDEILQKLNDIEEKRAFEKLKEDRKIEPVVLIAHPKFIPMIREARAKGANVAVLWSRFSDEDKIYQVTDPIIRENIIEICERRNL